MSDALPILVCTECGQQVKPYAAWRLEVVKDGKAGELLCCPNCCRPLQELGSVSEPLDEDTQIHPAALKEAEDHEIAPPRGEEDYSQVREDEGEMFI